MEQRTDVNRLPGNDMHTAMKTKYNNYPVVNILQSLPKYCWIS